MKKSFLCAVTAIGLLGLLVKAKSFASEINDHSVPAPTPPNCVHQDVSPDATDDIWAGEVLKCFLLQEGAPILAFFERC
ncbi:hypothetical protein ACWGS9_23465 [Bradyrhizobium sp. Arg314]